MFGRFVDPAGARQRLRRGVLLASAGLLIGACRLQPGATAASEPPT